MTDFDHILRSNLEHVFNECNPEARLAAIEALYGAEPVMFEPDAVVEGKQAIADVAGALQERFGPDFRFVPQAAAVGHHGFACLRWHAGPSGGPVAVTGTDAAEIVDGRIARLWVLLDPPPGS